MSEKETKKISDSDRRFMNRFDTIIAFLGVEIIGLAIFGFGGGTGLIVFQFLGLLLTVFAWPFLAASYSRQDIKDNLSILLPLGIFFLLLSFSLFWFRRYSGDFFSGFLYSFVELVGLIGFFFLGLCLRAIPRLKKEYVVAGILGALALYCLIVLFYYLIRYGFFYAWIYRGKVYYYEGVVYSISVETKMLFGFEFVEGSLSYACIPAVILSCGGVGFFYVRPAQKRKFFFLLITTLIGLAFLLFIPYRRGLIIVGAVYVFFALFFLLRHKEVGKPKQGEDKVMKIIYYVFCGIVILGLLLLFLEPFTGLLAKMGLVKITDSGGNLVGRYVLPIEDIYYGGAANKGYGFRFEQFLFGYSAPATYSSIAGHFTDSFEFNMLWQNGFPCFALLVYFILISIKKEREFLLHGDGDPAARFALVGMMLGLFVYASFFADELPLIHGQQFLPFSRGAYFFFLVFLVAYTFPKKEVAHE